MKNLFENFNPLNEAKFKEWSSGDTQEFPLEKDGKPLTIVDDAGIRRQLVGPAIFLKKSTLIKWLKSVYPECGLKEDVIAYGDKEVNLKISIFAERNDNYPLSEGFAHVNRQSSPYGFDVVEERSDDLYPLAFYVALKTAMEHAGFILDYDPDRLMTDVPGFKEACHAGEIFSEKGFIDSENTEVASTTNPMEGPAPEETVVKTEVLGEKEHMPSYVADGYDDPLAAFSSTYIEEEVIELATGVNECSSTEEIVPLETEDITSSGELSEDLGNTVFEVMPKASMSLKKFDGLKLKDISIDFLIELSKRDDPKGNFSMELLGKIKSYVAAA